MLEKLKTLLKECLTILESMSPSVGYGEKPAPKFTWGLIVPHTKSSGGASSKEKNINEYNYGLKLAALMPIPRETRDEGGVSLAAKRLKLKGCNASLEPHKNAYNGTAKGFEILVLENDSESIRVAEIMAENFKAKYPTRVLRHTNGVKKIKSGDRGYSNLIAAKKEGMKIALLGEAFFIDNPAEWIEPEEMAKFWMENLV
jgi:hypothetical protein